MDYVSLDKPEFSQAQFTGFVQGLEFLKTYFYLQSNFPNLEKDWKINTKSGGFFLSCNMCLIYK